MTAREVRRWLAGFEEAAAADREDKRRRGPRPEWSIATSLSLLRAARQAAGGRLLITPTRESQVEAVREVWARLRFGARR